eukprot:4841669-Amphidinium_carterae.1
MKEDDVIEDLTHKSFVKMIAPSFPTSATTEDRVAIMKRSWSVCFGNKNVFVRPPTESTRAKISKYSYWPQGQKLGLLSDEGIAKMATYKTGCMFPPVDDIECREWSRLS